jgi:hypothetical protein
MVSLSASCEFAQLSAKLDPDFIPRLWAARREALGWHTPSILDPAEVTAAPQPTTTAHEIHQTSLF